MYLFSSEMAAAEVGLYIILFYSLIFLVWGIVSGAKKLRVENGVLRVGDFLKEIRWRMLIPGVMIIAGGLVALVVASDSADAYRTGVYNDEGIYIHVIWENYSKNDMAFWRTFANAFGAVTFEFQKLVAVAVGAAMVGRIGLILYRLLEIMCCGLEILSGFLGRLIRKIPIRL